MKTLFCILISITALPVFGQTYSKTGLIRNSENIYDFFHHSESQSEKLLQILKIDTAQTSQVVNFKLLDRSHQLTFKNFLIMKEILNLNIMKSIIQAYYERPQVDYYEKLRSKINSKDFFVDLNEKEAKALYQDLQLMLISIEAFKKVSRSDHKPKFYHKFQMEELAAKRYMNFIFNTLYTATAISSLIVATHLIDTNTPLLIPKLAFAASLATYTSYKGLLEAQELIKYKRIRSTLQQVDRFKNIPKNTIENLKKELEQFNNGLLKQTKVSAPIFCQRMFF